MLVSIVTPALNEARTLPLRARELQAQAAPWEWIVADGGSKDGTGQIAANLGARVVHAPRGRGTQLNAGAAAARGEILLFLHADTSLPQGALDAVRAALADENVAGGNFTFGFDDEGAAARFLAWVYLALQHLLGVWFGDSTIFCRARVFAQLGGFPDFPIMEDLAFVDRLRTAGKTIRLAAAIRTSPRRYRGKVLQTIARWTMMLVLYRCGVSPYLLARWYRPHCDHPTDL
jgi:rSAM/selenodomain-associated transferase 2